MIGVRSPAAVFLQRARAALRGTAWRWSASPQSLLKAVIHVKSAKQDEGICAGQTQSHAVITDFLLHQTPEASDSLLIALLILLKNLLVQVCAACFQMSTSHNERNKY